MADGRFHSVFSDKEFILEQENKNTPETTERDIRLLETFLKTKDEDRNIEEISAVELNEYISQFIISIRIKKSTEYEPTWLRSLIASFERHLKKKGYSASIINDLIFEKTRKAKTAKEARKRERAQHIDSFDKRRFNGLARQGFALNV